jgi:hypothetical protein
VTKPRRFLTPAFAAEIADRYQRGETQMEIVRALGTCDTTVRRALKLMAVPVRRQPRFTVAESEERFWTMVTKGASNECWPFTGFCDKDGYGRTRVAGERTSAARAAFFYTYGYWPEVARHTCDFPPCCNPAHIIDGDHLENMRDAQQRRRFAHGTRARLAKLTEEDVLEIRTLVGLCRITDLGRAYGVSANTIKAIKTGASWQSV